MDNLFDFCVYDRLLLEPMARRGWDVDEISWRDDKVKWNVYEVVIVRSPWDYQDDPDAFRRTLSKIVEAGCILENSISLIDWNISKRYLVELENKGVPIVPTFWFDTFDCQAVSDAMAQSGGTEFIIKPVVSANADDTFRVNTQSITQMRAQLTKLFGQREFMLQPFLSAIQNRR